jgi:hypothetical protein
LLFGDQFNYCYVTDTVKLSDRVKLVCKENGLVEQSVSTHLRGFLPRNKSNQYHKKFIENAIKKFGDKFDYSKTEYTNRRNKVKIICEEHGEFEILPLNFLKNKYGCTKCGIRREKDIKEKKRINDSIKRYEKRKKVFFKKCYETHGDRYDYSKTEYINNNIKVKIICKKHGEFLQRASAHASGQGCMECRLEDRRIGLDLFLNRCYDIHGDRYDYSLVSEYKNNIEKVKVICKEHGVFEISPENHTNRKYGCSECRKLGLVKFIELSNRKHDYRYNYSLIKEYKDNKSKVKIICKEHGVFEQRVNDHISKGIGCPECTMDRFRLSTEDFIIRSNIIHNNKYIYSENINFKSNKDKIEIICKEHGIFKQRIDSHLRGQGCPKCKESKGESLVRNYLLDNNIEFITQKKFTDCVYLNELKFDFYLPEHNTCIEYNGRQHYTPIDYFGGEETFKYQLIRDNIKSEYCKNNNIHLIIIKYDEDILEKLTKYLI